MHQNAHFESPKMKIFWASPDPSPGEGNTRPHTSPHILTSPQCLYSSAFGARLGPQNQILGPPPVAFANLLLKFVLPARLCTQTCNISEKVQLDRTKVTMMD